MHRNTIAKYTKFSAEELQKSIGDPLSCVAAVQLNEILSLRPRDCEHIVKGVRRCVSERIGRYHPKLNGIVLGYAKIRIDNALSALRLDSPYLHVRATIDYYVFQPKIGSTLRGTVNYVSRDFVSAVIYRVFNVTVKLGKRAYYRQTITKGSEITFTVKSCDMKSELPVIEAVLVLNGVIPVSIKKEPGLPDSEDDVEVEANGINEEVKQPAKEPKQKKASKAPAKDAPAASTPAAPPVLAALASSSSSESEDEERSALIKSLLGQMFGDEYTKGAKDSKKSKKKKKETKKKSPQKMIIPETVRIKQEQLSMDEEESSEDEKNASSRAGKPSKQNGTNGVHLNGSVGAADDGQTPAKKRKIRFDLNPSVMHIKTEPTESSKKKKKTLNK